MNGLPSYDAFVDRAHARIYSQPEYPCRESIARADLAARSAPAPALTPCPHCGASRADADSPKNHGGPVPF